METPRAVPFMIRASEINSRTIDDTLYRTIFQLNTPDKMVITSIGHVLVLDNFYAYPYAVREFAQATKYEDRGLHPYAGRNGLAPFPINFIEVLQLLTGYSVRPFSTTLRANDIYDPPAQTQIHVDGQHGHLYAITAYLNHEWPLNHEHGTEFYRLGASLTTDFYGRNEPEDIRDRDPREYTKMFTVPMKFNRAAVYNGKYFHTASPAFGSVMRDCRLIHSMMFLY